MPEKIFSLNDYRPITYWIEQFLIDQEGKISSHTWTSYARSLELWRLYLESYYGETFLGEIVWEHLEEFFAWWYFRHYLGTSYTEIQVLLITLENFSFWLEENGILFFSLWQSETGRVLKQDVKRVFAWRKLKALIDSYPLKRRIASARGWFLLEEKQETKFFLIELNNNKEYQCQTTEQLAHFLQEEDFFTGFIWQEKDGQCFLDEQGLVALYPRLAVKYLR